MSTPSRPRSARVSLSLQPSWEQADDELVLIEGELRTPQWVSAMCAKPLRGNPSVSRRYQMNYPEHDATTPSWQAFREITHGVRKTR